MDNGKPGVGEEPSNPFVDSGSSPPAPAQGLQAADGNDRNDGRTAASATSESQERKTTARLAEIFKKNVKLVLCDKHGTAHVLLQDRRVHELLGRHVKAWLKKEFLDRYGFLPQEQSVVSYLSTLEFVAQQEGASDVHIRVAGTRSAIFIDLGGSDGAFIEVTAEGWRQVDSSPYLFKRPAGMLPMSTPTRGGSVDLLAKHLRCDREQFMLAVGWLLGAFCPFIEYPPLELTGPQGASKSTTMRFLRSLVDPAQADSRSAPRSERDIFLAANSGWVISLDNLSRISETVSNALCMAATGGTFGTRKLYSDAEEHTSSLKNPVILNGLTDVTWKSDLVERLLAIQLRPLPKNERKGSGELQEAFEADRPAIIGGLLDALVCALKHWPNTKAPAAGWPRMAQFARLVTAAEPALGWRPGSFVEVMHKTRRQAAEVVLDDYDGLVDTLNALPYRYSRSEDEWVGTATELFDMLKARCVEQQRYAASAATLTKLLRRLEGPLKELGFGWRQGKRQANQRPLIITRALATEDE